MRQTRAGRPGLVLGLCIALMLTLAGCTLFGGGSADGTPSPNGPGDNAGGGAVTPTATPVISNVSPTATRAPDRASVSGKPTPARAERGGTLTAAIWYSDYAFNTWEEVEGASFVTMHPLHNMLAQPRTWGSTDDFQWNGFLEIHPDLASGWETSPDGLSVLFSLRRGVSWSDGTPLTCEDVAWSYNTIRTSEGLIRSPRAAHMSVIEDVTCRDSLTVVFSLTQPKPALLDAIALPHNIVRPRHIYANDTPSMRDEPPAVTTGPFVIDEYLPGERITYRRNDAYWDQPFPYLDGLEMVAMEESAMPAALRTGVLHVGRPSGYSGEEAELLDAECGACQFWPRTLALGQTHHLLLNHAREPWNDSRLKEAVALAVDNTKYVRNVHNGWHVSPTGCGLYPSSVWAMPIERCTVIPGYGDFATTSSPAADKARAREILAALGYSPGELSLSLLFSPDTEKTVSAVISDLQQIGINAASDVLADDQFTKRLSEGEFDAVVHADWAIGVDPDLLLYGHFYTDARDNFNGFSSAEVDDLIDAMSMDRDPDSRRNLAWDALELALEEQAKIIVSHGVLVPVYGSSVRGLMPAPDFLAEYGPHLRYDHVWLSD